MKMARSAVFGVVHGRMMRVRMARELVLGGERRH